ncbi:TetR/AcrR family transcriptional regulator [Belnapia rosea]|uniref:Transcriptional regulator, TetR family n=1 Tax=Belnapia rosea TaxID=938405 RepID=A0A1G6TRX7_9PROT|nr:TetR/AcrR family transcriptional regulator [Belnapia rosea]SDD31820.1 transcriptional regulator, TetR family [Belnapia rosea]
MTTKSSRPRGRPRRFDPDQAVATAQRLFHARGYDAVSVADLTEALGINPPSFYAAFGSKAGLYARILGRYTAAEGVPLAEILRPGRPVAEALTEMLEEAARRYAANPAAADPAAAGCLTIEGARCNDPEARKAARALTAAAEDTIRRFVAATHPEAAGRLADYVVTIMTGLSTMAREGHGLDRLLATARLASLALAHGLRA